MSISLFLICLTITLLSSIVVGKTAYNRKQVTCMTGMMIAMTMGMIVGLTVGVVFGILFMDNFFLATILGMIVGMVIGFLAGIPVSVMAVLDGLLSGLMGGMMGAMLGAMIVPEYHEAIVKIMFFLFLATLFILLYMMQREVSRNKANFYSNPLITIALFGLFFVVFNQLGPIFKDTVSPNQNHGDHHSNENNLLIKAEEYTFKSNQINVQAGEIVTLQLENIGEEEHDLEIIGLEADNIKQNSTYHDSQEMDKIHLHAPSGEKQSISFIPIEKGLYRFVCTLPGHEESGMFGTFEVL